MVKLHYEAVTKTGELIAGEMKATSEREALRLLSAQHSRQLEKCQYHFLSSEGSLKPSFTWRLNFTYR